MSQVTRCPACHTRFKVVADQLRISQGWVRCGVCHEVFDASQDLQPLDAPPAVAAAGASPVPSSTAHAEDIHEFRESMWLPMPASAPAGGAATAASAGTALRPAPSPVPEPPPASPQMPASEPARESVQAPTPAAIPAPPVAQSPVPEQAEPAQAAPQGGELAQQAPDSEPLVAPGLELPGASLADEVDAANKASAELSERSQAFAHARAHAAAAPSEPAADGGAEGRAGVPAQDSESPASTRDASMPGPQFSRWRDSDADDSQEADLPEAEPGFVRQARRKAFWRRPVVRALLLLGILGAVAALGGQVMWQQRDALAVQHPALVPALKSLCELAGCELQPRRQIADVVISSSGFRQTSRSDQFQWSLSLENRSDFAVATPAVELTLTDAQDKPLLRRVIRLDQLGAPAQIEAHGEWTVTAPVEVQELEAAVAGYRALVFYP